MTDIILKRDREKRFVNHMDSYEHAKLKLYIPGSIVVEHLRRTGS